MDMQAVGERCRGEKEMEMVNPFREQPKVEKLVYMYTYTRQLFKHLYLYSLHFWGCNWIHSCDYSFPGEHHMIWVPKVLFSAL